MNINDTVAPYLTYCRDVRLVSPSTHKKYSECFELWIKPHLGTIPVQQLGKHHLSVLYEGMQLGALSISRRYAILTALKGLLRYIKDNLGQKTLDPRRVEVPFRGNRNVLFLTDSELEQIFDAIPIQTFSGLRLRAFIELLLGTGVRLSEALSLDRDIFDAGANEAEVRGKGGKIRTIFFNRRCLYWLKLYLSRRFDSHPALFVTTGLEPSRWQRADISRFFLNLRDKAKLAKRVTPHILRHTYCTHLRNNGVDISHIKDLAGHADISTTARFYLGVDRKALRKISETLVAYKAGALDGFGQYANVQVQINNREAIRPSEGKSVEISP